MSKWEASTAGGSLNTDKFDINPQFKMVITGAGPQLLFVKVEVAAPAEHSVGIHLFGGGQRVYRRGNEGPSIFMCECVSLFVASKLTCDLTTVCTCACIPSCFKAQKRTFFLHEITAVPLHHAPHADAETHQISLSPFLWPAHPTKEP